MTSKRTIIAQQKGVIPENADDAWLASLPSCAMSQFKRLIEDGGQPLFVLAQDSTILEPVWLLLAIDKGGQVFRTTTSTNPVVRRLESIRQVYKVARTCSFKSLAIPVEHRR